MNKNVHNPKNLRKELKKYILNLGVDKRFLENPAFDSALAEIDSLISRMYMFEASEQIGIKVDDQKIDFEYVSPSLTKYTFTISCSNPNSFSCIRTEENKPYLGTNGKWISEKSVTESVTTINNNGTIDININEAKATDFDCKKEQSKIFSSAEKRHYSPNGVMISRTYKSFNEFLQPTELMHLSVSVMLNIPRLSFNGLYDNRYNRLLHLTRDKLDTANILVIDYNTDFRYSAVTELNSEHGLRDMVTLGGHDPFPQKVFIPKLSQEEIEKLINKEKNPKVVAELRQLAIGREEYEYNSVEDKNFAYEGTPHSNGRTR